MHLWISLSVRHNHLFFWWFASVRTKKEPRMKRKIHFSLMLSPSLLTAPLFLSYFSTLYVLFRKREKGRKSCLHFFALMPLREASRKWPFRGISHFSSHKSSWWELGDVTCIMALKSWYKSHLQCPSALMATRHVLSNTSNKPWLRFSRRTSTFLLHD